MAYLSIPFIILVVVIVIFRFICDLFDDLGK